MVSDDLQNPQPMQLDEWELLSQLHPTNDIQISDLDILGRHDFDKNHNWHDTTIPLIYLELAINFIQNNRSHHHLPQPSYSDTPNYQTLSPTQTKSHSIVMNHSTNILTSPPLRMVVQGITGTGKSFFIRCIRESPSLTKNFSQSPILLLAPTDVVAFNIQASAIHSTLQILIKNFMSLEGNSLSKLQEELTICTTLSLMK